MKKKILIVNDGLFVQELACDILTEQGYECRMSSSAISALKMIDREGFIPDLVVTEAKMSVLNDMGLVQQLRIRGIRAIIVFTSAHPDSRTMPELKQFSPWFLSSPFRIEELEMVVRSAMPEPDAEPVRC